MAKRQPRQSSAVRLRLEASALRRDGYCGIGNPERTHSSSSGLGARMESYRSAGRVVYGPGTYTTVNAMTVKITRSSIQ